MKKADYIGLIEKALEEDLNGSGDVTSSALFDSETCTAHLISKDSGILSGSEIFSAVFEKVDEAVTVSFHFEDGQRLRPGERVAEISGSIQSILCAERTALNFLSYLSGISSVTDRIVTRCAENGGTAQVLDTRKTLPGYRSLAKYAVQCGGGTNHRMGLYDMVMIKDNHVDGAGSITAAVSAIKKRYGNTYRIEVECRNLQEVTEALECQVDVIMLDNMEIADIRQAVKLRNERNGKTPKLEVSGNMGLETVAGVSETGVDYISVGSLTHSVTAFDFSLKIG